MEEIKCASCDSEFTIIHEEELKIEYCPYCGSLLSEELEF